MIRPEAVRAYVAVGDSTTEGIGDPAPDGTLVGWADRFATLLATRSGGVRYANLAVRGKRTAQILAEQAAPAAALEPDLITAVVGVNDLVAPSLDLGDFGDVVNELYATLRSRGAAVVSATLPDLSGLVPLPGRALAELRRRHAAVNEVIIERAAAHQVVVLPLGEMVAATDRRVWRPDRLHPNPVGHALLAEGMLRLLDGEAPAVTPEGISGYGTLPYARPGALWSAAWVARYLLPRTVRRLRGRSSGDGRTAKYPTYVELSAPAVSA